MAVYTHVDRPDLETFLEAYAIGDVIAFRGIESGVENSNFYVETKLGKYILTLFENRVSVRDIPYFLDLKKHLASKTFPCPLPVEGRDGEVLRTLSGRPATIVTFLEGAVTENPSTDQCRLIGASMARMHLALQDYDGIRPNDLGPAGWKHLWKGLAGAANAIQIGLSDNINGDLAETYAAKSLSSGLPRGTIHADLFPDNVFFAQGQVSGIIDFYFACTDALAYDLAVSLNAWAFDPRGQTFYKEKSLSLIDGYNSVRALSSAEVEALPLLARGAALRFFLTRLTDWVKTSNDALVKPHDPMDFVRRLEFHRKMQTATDYGY